MSASLVGSEMCIRDRSMRPSPMGGRRATHTGHLVTELPRFCAALSATTCLLYTSDAADDM
eukprot:7532566-Alexandrium_andersonii.AAC.1